MANHFVYDSGSIPSTKTNFGQIPARIPSGSAVTATEFNQLLQAFFDLRDHLHSGTFTAYQRAAPGATSPYTGTLQPIRWDMLWVNSSGSLIFRKKSNVDVIIVSGSG